MTQPQPPLLPASPLSEMIQRAGQSSNLDLNALYQMILLQQQQIDALALNQKHNLDIVDGDPSRDLPGLRVRMKEAEAVLEEWKRYKLIVKGIAIGMTLTMVTSVSTLITIISQAVKGTP